MAADVVIYHNPACGTSRNALGLIRNAGIEPHVIEYLKTPPSRALLVELIGRAGLTPRDLLREKGTPFAELGLGDPALSDDELVDAMIAHPILINRPLVVSPVAVKLCRPSETVLDLLPAGQLGAFVEEDGAQVVDSSSQRIAESMSTVASVAGPAPARTGIGTFERYLTLRVALCIVAGIGLGHLLPGLFATIAAAEVARVNLVVAVLIWLMIVPMLLKIDFGSLGSVRQHWKGVGVTLFINWGVKPFSMAALGTFFIGHLFAPLRPPARDPPTLPV